MMDRPIDERRIASSHLVLVVPFTVLAIGGLIFPVWGLFTQWRWLIPAEKLEVLAFDLFLVGICWVLLRTSFARGIFASTQGVRIQGIFRSKRIRWDEIGKIAPGVGESWAVLQTGSWGELRLDNLADNGPRRMFIPDGGVFISTVYSRKGLKDLSSALLRNVPSQVWQSDPEGRQWLMDQMEGRGSLLSRLI